MIKKMIKLADIEVLCRSNCRIKEPERVERILNEFVIGGSEKLQVVTDFDFTITKQRTDNGKIVQSSFNMFYQCKSLPDSCRIQSAKLLSKYRPIEIDPSISYADKLNAMVEWWTMSSDLLKYTNILLYRIYQINIYL